MRADCTRIWSVLLLSANAALAEYSAEVVIDRAQRSPISPYIYGSNQNIPGVTATARRQGGNRMTGYNWENNASNAGSDWQHSSDNFLTWVAGIAGADESKPGIVVTDFHEDARAQGSSYNIVTLQLAGFVAKDKSGSVSAGESAPSGRWVEVRHNKGSALSLVPDLGDSFVYTDEFVNFLVNRFGNAASPAGIRGYSLDNEPALWPHTHVRIHPATTTVGEIRAKNIEAAATVKRVDPSAEVFGPVLYGVGAYINMQDATDWAAAKATGDYSWFIDYYLAEMRKAGNAAGRRLLDVLDVHLYSENRGGNERVTDSTNWGNIECNKARIDAPRAFYDATFVENSWIGQYFAWTMPYLGTLQASIAKHYPDTKLAVTEYNFGGESHVSGGIAQADILGAFGTAGVYLATWWQLHDNPSYIAAAFNLYRNYDGAGGKFGDTSLKTATSNVANVSAYASYQGSDDSRLHVVLLNKHYTEAGSILLKLGAGRSYSRARVYGFDSNGATISSRPAVAISGGNEVVCSVAPLTALHLVFDNEVPEAESSGDSRLVNLSTRAVVGAGDRVLIAGFYVAGSGTKKLLVRGVGPKLTSLGVAGAIADPRIELRAATGGQLLAENDNWGAAPNQAEVAAAVQSMGLSFDVGSKDAAMIVTVPAGAGYTVLISGTGGVTGVGLAEIYDLDATGESRLSNLSSRGYVGTGNDLMIAGFVVRGSGARRLLVRAAGPALIPFNVSGTLADPVIRLTTDAGTVVKENNDWTGGDVSTLGSQVGAFAFSAGSKDAGLVSTRTSGSYTALVSGQGNGTGVALVEVYEIP